MRKLSSLASWAAPQIQYVAAKIQIPIKPRNLSPTTLKSHKNIVQNRVVSAAGKLEFKDSSSASISPPKSHISDRDQRLNSRVIDHGYLAEILSRKDWFLLLNHDFDANRGNLNATVVVSVLQNQENVLCALRFYVWISKFSASLAKNQMIRSALGNALYRKGPVLLSADLIHDIRNSGCQVSEELLCALIGSWGRLGLAKYCSEVFEQVSYLGVTPNTRLYNSVIDGLVKSNSLDLAYLKFQQMEVDGCVPDRYTYNILIHGVCKAGVVGEALRLVKQMEALGYSPNVFTYTILMDGYIKARSIDEAFRLLETMKNKKVIPNEATYRSLINGVFSSVAPVEAFRLLSRWVDSELDLPKVVFDSVICHLCGHSLAKQAADFLRKVEARGYFPNSSIANIAMTCLIKGLDVEETCQIFEHFIKRSVKVDLRTGLALVEALYRSMREEKGNQYIRWILEEGLVNSVFSYNMVIDCFCKAEMMNRALETFGMMTKKGFFPNVATFNTIITGYYKSRDVDKAREMLLMLFSHGFRPDVFTFSSMIDGLFQVNRTVDAFDCFEEMLEWGVTPNAVTYNSLIRSLCLSGNVSKAMRLLRKMQIDGIQPDMYTFNALIKKYCRDRKIDKAHRLLKSMLTLGLRPDNFTYIAFINVLCECERFHEAKGLLTSMEMNGCKPDAYTCNSFIDALVKSGRSQEAMDVWSKYKEKGLTLKPVLSGSEVLVG
ncbi:putative pentatricopeptide repeat-containing protein At3g16890, mitochondrial [Salvia splendens]|uniref:putative pentatricopeptide repeat-containing protein At3g16890, mitochondrial n=1 Tax=Salvia splendens TaxID=180675 RepID=UPI0011008038|nr:putative pentatricopeptide repeat-containing protein At3g16890, mitochondrial [Salvia splendens]XP_042050749.1 putative pentatricopeptide repeat-containing protein At3g16890, mitochondrial [Salvia splendens]XP_042050750.1 putative pentatricopeptide repeat-containing protein At3g16890, mitochondrial [Salvia splendens]XP_042050751.1 putative pentatricopeptide repeat-containing protein At3g16890, mitochondrial [Salvia splendens]XP_042050752.1 putative pentatricopeptide repeat-containing protein